MTASTPQTIYAVSPLAGAAIGNKSSTASVATLTKVWANDGKHHIYLKANGSLGSTANITAGASGSAVSAASAGVATYTVDTGGGVVTGQYFWAKSTASV